MRNEIAVFKLMLWRGGGYLQFFMNIGIISANIGIFHEFIPEGMSLSGALVLGAAGYVVVSVLLGYIDREWGIWEAEAAYSSKELNPFWREMSEKVSEIHDNSLPKR